MKLKKWEIIEIKWIDSCSTTGWRNEDNFDKDDRWLNQTTVGYFLIETRKGISVVQSKSEWEFRQKEQKVNSIITIPKGAIKKIIKIK